MHILCFLLSTFLELAVWNVHRQLGSAVISNLSCYISDLIKTNKIIATCLPCQHFFYLSLKEQEVKHQAVLRHKENQLQECYERYVLFC